MMPRRLEITVKFTVNEEQVPGIFHDPQEFADSVAEDILYRLVSYKPAIVSTDVQLLESNHATTQPGVQMMTTTQPRQLGKGLGYELWIEDSTQADVVALRHGRAHCHPSILAQQMHVDAIEGVTLGMSIRGVRWIEPYTGQDVCNAVEKCSIQGCNGLSTDGKGLCKDHYYLQCSIQGCNETPTDGKGLCRDHYYLPITSTTACDSPLAGTGVVYTCESLTCEHHGERNCDAETKATERDAATFHNHASDQTRELRVTLALRAAKEALVDPDRLTKDMLCCELQRIQQLLEGEAYYDYDKQEWVAAVGREVFQVN